MQRAENNGNGGGRRLVAEVLTPMKEAFVGKDEIIDLMGICLIAGENLFLLGPPGTAKSALVHDLAQRLRGRSFEYLLTRFTEPNELFGPFDIRRLREGELVTNTEGMLPEASLIFLDELLNANSAVLNSLLTVLNERMFRRGRETRELPVLMVVGASNHLPEDEALMALYDRFLVRARCENVDPDRLGDVLVRGAKLDLGSGPPPATLDVEDLRQMSRGLIDVDLQDVRPALAQLVMRLRHAGLPISDRRAVKLQRLVAASAILCDRKGAMLSDLWVFRHIWDKVEQQEVVAGIVQDALKQAEPDALDHPRARADMPDPEELARELEAIGPRVADKALPAAERSVLRDRLAVLAGRTQWVGDERARTFLAGRVEQLMKTAAAGGDGGGT